MKSRTSITKNFAIRSITATALMAAMSAIGSNVVFAQSMPGMQHGDMKSMGSDGSTQMHMTMQESQKKMNNMQMSGDTDHDFAMMMRAHHQAGVDMAKVEVASGKDPEMIKEAKKIISSQQKDIQKFDAWMQKHPSK
jgi:uncharacterized protein (DUF305 family)